MDNDTGGQTCNLVESGTTPLHWAAKCGHCEICRLIMDNVTNKNPPDLDGWTPLHLAGKLRYKKFIFESYLWIWIRIMKRRVRMVVVKVVVVCSLKYV